MKIKIKSQRRREYKRQVGIFENVIAPRLAAAGWHPSADVVAVVERASGVNRNDAESLRDYISRAAGVSRGEFDRYMAILEEGAEHGEADARVFGGPSHLTAIFAALRDSVIVFAKFADEWSDGSIRSKLQ